MVCGIGIGDHGGTEGRPHPRIMKWQPLTAYRYCESLCSLADAFRGVLNTIGQYCPKAFPLADLLDHRQNCVAIAPS